MATQSQHQLDNLPIEIIRRIVIHGSFSSARSLSSLNRTLYQCCKDWSVYRDLVNTGHSKLWTPEWNFIDDQAKYEAWVRFAFADSKAAQFLRNPGDFTGSSFARWGPHLMALHHPMSFSIKPKDIGKLISTTRSEQSLALKFCDIACIMLREAQPKSSFRECQAEFYLETTGYSMPTVRGESHFYRLQVFPMSPASEGFYPQKQGHASGSPAPFIMQIAYSALYALNFEIITGFARPDSTPGFPNDSLAMLPVPPKSINIPFSSFMDIPMPFSLCCAEMFGICHLPRMASLEFIDDGDWTGYVFERFIFDIQWKPRQGIQFLTNMDKNHPDYLFLDSYNMISRLDCFYLKGRLGRDTGKIDLVEYHPEDGSLGVSWQAVLTPFGIVASAVDREEQRWMWLWKSKWSNDTIIA